MKTVSALWLAGATALLLLPSALAGGVLAVDYGTEWTKLSLVKPGIPFDVLLNRDSKRKIQSVVAIRGEDRTFGGDAASLAARFPQNVYAGVKLLLGQSPASPHAAQHRALFSLPLSPTLRSTVRLTPSLSPSSNTSFLPEEILAMQLAYARELAEAAAREKVQDAIVAVPSYLTQFERQAVLDAMDLAGLRSLALVDDGATVAVNYAMTRSFTRQPEVHVIYDAGAGAIKATVAAFTMSEQPIHPKSKTLKNVTSIEIKGTGWDRGVGGWRFDERIRDVLRREFEEKSGVGLEGNGRAMAKLLREATRLKQVLSANAESQARIESLADDIDFKSSFSRQQFEDSFAADVPRFTQPIQDALEKAGLTLADVRSVILVGGSSRVPMIQTAVKDLVGEDKVAVNVNADEAAVMGAALYGAGLSRQFKTKDIRLTGVAPYAIEATHHADLKDGEAAKNTQTALFPVNARTGVKRTMKLKKTSDFVVDFSYPSPPETVASRILQASVEGVSKALANHTNVTGVEVPAQNVTVKLAMQMSESGILSAAGASLTIPSGKMAESTLGGRLAGFFGGKKEGKEGETGGAGEGPVGTGAGAAGGEEPADGSFEAEEAKLKAALEGKPKDANETVPIQDLVFPLTVVTKYLGVEPMSTAEKIESGKLLRELRAAETRKRAREEARNTLEAYTYRVRDLLDNSDWTKAATKAELSAIKGMREQVAEWLGDWAETATAKELKQKKGELEKMEQPVSIRIDEDKRRPGAYLRSETSLKQAREWLETMKTEATLTTSATEDEQSRFTQDEVTALEKLVADTEAFFKEKRKLQDAKKLWEDPAVRVSDMDAKLRVLDGEVARAKKKRAPPKKRARPTAAKESLEDLLSSLNVSYTSFGPGATPTLSDFEGAAEPTMSAGEPDAAASSTSTSTATTTVAEAETAAPVPEQHDEL